MANRLHGEEATMSASNTASEVRELAHRRNDGIDVVLLWDPGENAVSVRVEDSCSGDRLDLAVDPAHALAAFHHPFAQAAQDVGMACRAPGADLGSADPTVR